MLNEPEPGWFDYIEFRDKWEKKCGGNNNRK
jgi:hypothetical protein